MEPFIPNQTVSAVEDIATEDVLESQIREIFGRTVYSHKTHEKCAEEYLFKHSVLKTSQIVLSAIMTGSLLLAVFGDNRPATIIGAILSTILFALSAYTKDYDFGRVAQRHSETANQLWGVREDYFSLLTDIAGKLVDIQRLLEQRDHLQQRLDKIYSSAPRTTSIPYKAAQRALQRNQEMTLSAEEIDAFLPQPLRRASQRQSEPPVTGTSGSSETITKGGTP